MVVANPNKPDDATLPNVLVLNLGRCHVKLARESFGDVTHNAAFVFNRVDAVKLDLYRASCNNHDNILGMMSTSLSIIVNLDRTIVPEPNIMKQTQLFTV